MGINILIVDDSKIIRGVISKTFSVSISGSNVYRITRLKFYYTEEGTIWR
jgi:CheY-like chemotaxis protein